MRAFSAIANDGNVAGAKFIAILSMKGSDTARKSKAGSWLSENQFQNRQHNRPEIT